MAKLRAFLLGIEIIIVSLAISLKIARDRPSPSVSGILSITSTAQKWLFPLGQWLACPPDNYNFPGTEVQLACYFHKKENLSTGSLIIIAFPAPD